MVPLTELTRRFRGDLLALVSPGVKNIYHCYSISQRRIFEALTSFSGTLKAMNRVPFIGFPTRE